ncbi:MAG TPA: GNAT family N-acetyltransferase [Burkholderiales bacterium]|nr:GNAT family N-acetyltransferase [Burkholderiales bacterium]
MTNSRDDFISTSPQWFTAWLKYFGGPAGQLWQDTQSGDRAAIAIQRERATIGPIPIAIGRAAANSHTPRFDALGKLDDASSVERLMRDMNVAMLSFPYLSAQSQLLRAVQASALLHQVEFCEAAPFIDCRGSWDDYWQSRGKSRTEWGRRERRLMEDQKARCAMLTQWDEIEPIFEQILAIEASGWKGQEGSAIVQSPQTLGFYKEMARYWSEAGALRLFVLYIGEQAAAFELNAEYRGVLNCIKHGYDEALAKQGPGQVLRMQVLKWAFAQPQIKTFDMYGPQTEAKMKWATGVENLHTLRVFRDSLSGRLAHLRYVGLPKLKRGLQGESAPAPQASTP